MRVSLFVKLLFLLFASWLAVMMFAAMFSRLGRSEPDRPFEGLADQLGRYLTEDIGDPPSLGRARDLSEDLGLAIAVEGRDTRWASDRRLSPLSSLRRHIKDGNMGFYRGQLFVIVEKGETRYLFMDIRDAGRSGHGFLATLALALALILGSAYLMMRRLLRPVRLLSEGVRVIAKGQLGYRVPAVSNDELGDLTHSFNGMAEKIEMMVASREQLLLDVSHELRSPLTRVRLGLELVDGKRARESLAEDIRAMETLITALLELNRMDSPHGRLELTKVDIVAIIKDVAETLADPSPGVLLDGFDSPLPLTGDSGRIRILVRNLLDNALRYNPDDGPPVRVILTRREGEVVLDVMDHGPGISETDQQSLFMPFFRADPSRSRETGGYGLGLALSRRIATAHGGRLDLIKGDSGAHFQLVLPVDGPTALLRAGRSV